MSRKPTSPLVARQCEYCQEIFYLKECLLKRVAGRFCSIRCVNQSRSIIHADPRTLEERFLSFVNKTDTCWLWTGGTDNHGYGQMSAIINGQARTTRSHRISWTIYRGPIPDGKHVLHDCDKLRAPGDTSYRLCVNPSHLFLGTRRENQEDMHRKGRSNLPQRKLNDTLAVQIRAEYEAGGVSQKALSEKYGVSVTTMLKLLNGRIYKHVLEHIPEDLRINFPEYVI